MGYPNGLRFKLVRRMSGPDAVSATELARETGVAQQTLSRWLCAASTVGSMSEPGDRRPQDWSAQEILDALAEAAGLSDEELGVFLRREGLHAADLKRWRQRMLAGFDAPVRSSGPSPQSKRIKELERELRRKEKALAEAAALLVLQKKVRAIWEDEDGDTDPKSDA